MQQHRATASLLIATFVALTLLGCNGAERQRQQEAERQRAAAAERERQLNALVNRCRDQQPAVQRQLEKLQRSNRELARLKEQTYTSLPRPAAPNPELLERFTRDDQELELERYEQALVAWRNSDRAKRRYWQGEQAAQRQRSAALLQQAQKALLAQGVADTPAARSAWSSCEPQRLAALTID
jgi:predicted negative regulator of RcsB-dependent stress response